MQAPSLPDSACLHIIARARVIHVSSFVCKFEHYFLLMGETTVTNYPYGPIGSSSVGWSGQGEKGRSLGGNTRSLGRKALDSDEEREEVRGNMRSLGRKALDSDEERGEVWG